MVDCGRKEFGKMDAKLVPRIVDGVYILRAWWFSIVSPFKLLCQYLVEVLNEIQNLFFEVIY